MNGTEVWLALQIETMYSKERLLAAAGSLGYRPPTEFAAAFIAATSNRFTDLPVASSIMAIPPWRDSVCASHNL